MFLLAKKTQSVVQVAVALSLANSANPYSDKSDIGVVGLYPSKLPQRHAPSPSSRRNARGEFNMPKKKLDFEELANQLAQELAEANDALLRERADASNVRRRADEDRIKLGSFYKANIVKEL